MVPSVRRFRWSFSLRSLLLITAILAVGLGWLMHKVTVYRAREATIASLRKVGVFITYDFDTIFGPSEHTGSSWLQLGERIFTNPDCLLVFSVENDSPPLCDLPFKYFANLQTVNLLFNMQTTDLSPLTMDASKPLLPPYAKWRLE